MFRINSRTDYHCRCDCCPNVPASGLSGDLLHNWNADALPHPYTVEAEVYGGAVINSHGLSIVDPPILFTPGPNPYQRSGTGSLRASLDITAPSGRWNAWLILWMPSSSVPVEEVVDVTDPNGIVLLHGFSQSAQFRLAECSHDHADGPYPFFGIVGEYDGQRYYSKHSYIDSAGNNPFDPSSVEEPIRPYCWRNVGQTVFLNSINPTTLNFNDDWPVVCAPSPAQFTRVGHVIGLTTVGHEASDDRAVSGTVTASIDVDNPAAVEGYAANCSCWWEPPISSLTATFENGPVEIEGDTLTLNRQLDGTFTALGTFGPDSLSYSMTYTPCGDLLLTFDSCGVTFTLNDSNQSNYRPVVLVLQTQVCYDGVFNEVPDCGLTTNATLPVGSPPFVQIWDCFAWSVRLEE